MSDDQFTKLSAQIASLDELITKLYQHTESQFAKLHDEMDQRFAKVDGQFDQVYGLIDEVLKNQETEAQERLAMNHQLDRHEDWIGRASKQMGVSYER